MLKFGNIDKRGDAGTDYENRYRVRLRNQVNSDGSPLLTGWLFSLHRSALNDQDDYGYDNDEAVAIEVSDDLCEGVIIGAINTTNAKPKTTDPDIEQKTFKDGSVVSYDRKNHVYTLDIHDGTINIKSKNDLKIDSTSGKVIINGGNNNGIPKVADVKTKLNNLESKVNTLITTLAGVSVVLAPTGTYPFAPIFSGISQLTPTQQADIEDTNATH